MSFQGQISSLALGDVVQNLVINKKTGTLTVRSQQLECHIQFHEGAVISYADNRGIEISRWLVDKDLVPANRMEEALRKYRRSKKKSLGATLRDQKSISLEDYKSHLTGLVCDGMCEALSLKEGSFEFHENDLSEKHSDRDFRALGLRLSAQNLIMEAARRSDDYEKIRRHLPSESEIYCASPSERDHLLETTEDEITRAAIRLLDGTRSMKRVIAKLPCSRFQAIRCLADLVAEKKVRPLDTDQAVERSDAEGDPKEAIERLKTILEREPGNRQVLNKLASLYETVGLPEESAKHRKMLANSHLDEGNLEGAKIQLLKSVKLNPKDSLAWQKLWDCFTKIGKEEDILSFGKEYLAHFKQLGFMEIVRDHLRQMVARFPDKNSFKLELAKAYVALGEQRTAIQGLSELGHDLLSKNRYDEAEKVFSLVLKFDSKNERARKICEEIHTGRLKRRRAFQKKLCRDLAFTGFAVLAAWFIVRELLVQNEYLKLMRTVFAEPVLERHRYEETRQRVEEISRKYFFSPTAAGQGSALLHALRHKEEKAGRRSAGEGASGVSSKSRKQTRRRGSE